MILFTSDIDKNNVSTIKTGIIYIVLSITCALFGAIYEIFSHEVYSYYLIYAFAIPLIFGALPYFIISISTKLLFPKYLSRNLYHSGIATLTVGSIIKGVLDIYGTTNSLVKYYFIFGISSIILSLILYIKQLTSKK